MSKKHRRSTVIGKPAPVVRTQVKIHQYHGSVYDKGGKSRCITVYLTADEVFRLVEPVLRQAVESEKGGETQQ